MHAPHCLVCGDPLSLDAAPDARAAVYCADCGTPHHEDCFSYGGACSVYGCGCLRFSRRGQHGREIHTFRTGGARPRQPERPVHERHILDLDTPLEVGLTLTATLAGLASLCALAFNFMVEGPRLVHPAWIVLSGGVAVLAAIIRSRTSCYYIADGATRRLWYHRMVLGLVQQYPVAAFDELKRVQLTGHRRREVGSRTTPARDYTEWRLEVLQRGGRRHLVMGPHQRDGEDIDRELEEAGSNLARLAGCSFELRRVPNDPQDTHPWSLIVQLVSCAAVLGWMLDAARGAVAGGIAACLLALPLLFTATDDDQE